ncbi:MAG: hypothetical protein HZA23_07365 [Nitrospirae bacterium]|nr:hypothetical protein [Nitrospirota bacterium]
MPIDPELKAYLENQRKQAHQQIARLEKNMDMGFQRLTAYIEHLDRELTEHRQNTELHARVKKA